MQHPPLSAYVHIPWCIHKCPYCDFNSHEFKDQNLKDNEAVYSNALIKQIENYKINAGRKLHTIFLVEAPLVYLVQILLKKLSINLIANLG